MEGLEQTLQTVDAGRGIETAKSAATTASTMKKRAVTAARDAVLPAEDRDNPFWGLDFARTCTRSKAPQLESRVTDARLLVCCVVLGQ